MSDSKEIRDAKNLLFIKEHEVLFANQEIARLKAELTDLKSEADRFKAEVERLRKAGDAMAHRLLLWHDDDYSGAWNVAKDGNPSE